MGEGGRSPGMSLLIELLKIYIPNVLRNDASILLECSRTDIRNGPVSSYAYQIYPPATLRLSSAATQPLIYLWVDKDQEHSHGCLLPPFDRVTTEEVIVIDLPHHREVGKGGVTHFLFCDISFVSHIFLRLACFVCFSPWSAFPQKQQDGSGLHARISWLGGIDLTHGESPPH